MKLYDIEIGYLEVDELHEYLKVQGYVDQLHPDGHFQFSDEELVIMKLIFKTFSAYPA